MIVSAKRARFFEWQNVRWLFDDAEQIRRARCVGANFAQLFRGEESAAMAWPHRLSRGADGAGNLFRHFIPGLHNPKRDAFSRAGTNSRHLAQLRDQFPERDRIFRSSQCAIRCRGGRNCE